MGVFHVFLNCTNGTKSRNAPHIFFHNLALPFYNVTWLCTLHVFIQPKLWWNQTSLEGLYPSFMSFKRVHKAIFSGSRIELKARGKNNELKTFLVMAGLNWLNPNRSIHPKGSFVPKNIYYCLLGLYTDPNIAKIVQFPIKTSIWNDINSYMFFCKKIFYVSCCCSSS